MSHLSDPKSWGPGVWFTIHLMAAKAVDTISKELFIDYLNVIIKNVPCLTCQEHATKYLRENPLIGYLTDEDPQGLFRWTWIFHNFVNSRLHKPFVDWNTAYSMFYGSSSICSGDCGGLSRKHDMSKYNIRYVDW